MEKSIFKKIITFLICLMIFTNIEKCFAQVKQGLADKTPAPHAKFQAMYVINADSGLLVMQKNRGGYELILDGVHNKVNFYINFPQKHSSFVATKKLLSTWKKQFSNGEKEVESNITGVQFSNKNVQSVFYEMVRLSHPRYDSWHHEATFSVKLLKHNSAPLALKKIDNVTLFINACDLCSCARENIECSTGLQYP